MKIAAINIPTAWIPPMAGQGRIYTAINLGGRNLYTLEENRVTSVKSNPFYLDDIFDQRVSLFSCIVGGNGGGKSSLLRLLTAAYGCIYVIEQPDGQYEVVDNIDHIHRIYYTPYLHQNIIGSVGNNGKDLSKLALIRMDNHGDSGLLDDFLEAHHSENSKRWIRFNHFYRQLPVQTISLPVFDKVKLSLRHFKVSIHKPDSFHDTSYEIRPALTFLFRKIQEEQQQQEITSLDRVKDKNLNQKQSDQVMFRVRLKYDLYEAALAKLISILEGTGNRYLSEGIIPDDFEAQLEGRNVREGIEWLLRNAGVHSGEERYYFSQHLILLELIDYVLSVADDEGLTDNWREIIISEDEALRIIELYDTFNNSFVNEWFKYDEHPMFGFEPQIAVSSGEQQFLNLFSTLYYHAQNIKDGVDIDLHSFKSLQYVDKDILLLLDEGDNGFHPQWKKEYIKYLRGVIPLIFSGFNIQIIITTHDPLTLSDLPKNNVVFLESGPSGTVIGNSDLKRTFGANVADLLKDSFFLQDGMIGSFAADIIDGVISDMEVGNYPGDRRWQIERIIAAIDEPVIKFKLAEMFAAATGDLEIQRRVIDEEIARLQTRRGRI